MNAFDVPPPALSASELNAVTRTLYGLAGDMVPLVSEKDQNVRLEAGGRLYVLKIANAAEAEEFLSFQNAALLHLEHSAPELCLPRLVRGVSGQGLPRLVRGVSGQGLHRWRVGEASYFVRLLTFLPGPLLADKTPTAALLESIGSYMGQLSKTLAGFDHAGAHRPDFIWNLDNALAAAPFTHDIAKDAPRRLVQGVFERYSQHVQPFVPALRKAVIHNDINDHNIVIVGEHPAIVGVIDFGDMVYGSQVNDLAVALAYLLMDRGDMEKAAGQVIRAYSRVFPLRADEADLLFDLVATRLAVSVAVSSNRAKKFPDNKYLTVSQAPALRLLAKLSGIPAKNLKQLARASAGVSL